MKIFYNLQKRVSINYNKKENLLIIKHSLGVLTYKLKNIYVEKKENTLKGFVDLSHLLHFFFLFENFLLLYKYNYYFNHLKVYGLGFRISIISATKIRLDFGWSHVVFFTVPSFIYLIKKKSELLVYSQHETHLRNFIFLVTSFYLRSPYTLKGVFNIHQKIHVKIGKQRQK